MRLLTLAAAEAGRWARSERHHLALCAPVTRTYTSDGRLGASSPGGPGAVVDVLELEPDEARALSAEARNPSAPMLVVGSFTPVADASTLGRFLVGGAVLDTNLFDGHRCPSEQTALGLWRIARLRGGAFWDGVAELVAAWVEGRITAATGAGPVHSVWGQGETHVRFLADAALLLLAARRVAAAERALELLEQLAVPFGGGRWYVHDSLELATGAPDLVINTHAQVLAVLAASGRPTAPGVRALEAALALRPRGSGRFGAPLAAFALAASDAAGSWGPSTGRKQAEALARWAQRRMARDHGAGPFVRLPGGYLARDAGPRGAPHYYAGVNLFDLGVLVANGIVTSGSTVDRAFEAALRWARATGYFRALRRSGTAIAALEPIILRQAGRATAADRARDRLVRSGLSPAPGWPGHVDTPWPAFRAGTL